MKVRLEMTRQVGENALSSIFGTGLASVAIYLILEGIVPYHLLIAWLVLQVILLYVRFHYAHVFNQFSEEDERWSIAVRKFSPAMFCVGTGWGLASIMTSFYGTLLDQVVVLAILLGIVGAAIGTVAQVLSAYTAFVLSVMPLQIFSFLLHTEKEPLMLGALTIVYSVVVWRAGYTLAANIRDLVEAREHLDSAKSIAEEASMAKSHFLSSMSHELRTPLNAILGFSQLLGRDEQNPARVKCVSEIRKAGEHLLALISDILTLSTMEAGELRVDIKPVDVNPLVAECREIVMVAADGDTVSINFKASGEDLQVSTDPIRLKQILLNFLSNAIKYNVENGSVHITVSNLDSTWCRIAVRDTGEGVPLELQDQLFQPFNRLGREFGSVNGSGIGLVICQQLAELMDATIGFRSIPGDGATFWLDIPLVSNNSV